MRDVRFRRALSLAIDRHEINQAIYFGLAIEGQNTVLPQSPLYPHRIPRRPGRNFDIDEANRLLDVIGLDQARCRGHAAAAGRTAGRDHRRGFGRVDRKIRRARADPRFLAAHRHQALHQAVAADPVPATGVLRRDADVDRQGDRERPRDRRRCRRGVRADQPAAARMAEMGPVLSRPRARPARRPTLPVGDPAASSSTKTGSPRPSEAEHARIWHDMLQIWADEVFSIGLVAGVLQPIVVNDRLRNVPERRHLQLGPGRAFRHLQAGRVLVRPARHRRRGELSRRRDATTGFARRRCAPQSSAGESGAIRCSAISSTAS